LILDEPFGALDAITKEEMQEELLTIWREHQLTVLMITHDIDEALFLADRLVMMTNGPSAKIGEILEIPFARPRNRSQISEDPKFYELRNYALDFLFSRFAHDEDLEDGLSDAGEAAPKHRLALKIGGIIGGLALFALVSLGIHQSFAPKSDSDSKTPAIEAPAGQ
jgi:nitrate/nitrite transport system ATP-binding protein